ncbi:hypothetical protein [Bacillus taeanensis]|uniref:Uncharacterized protein n=1 Tax=Bacillus taeanensis TaxID=273032 RepID=A0A366XWD0_9BACI|nr:hypothetical protein [Bacillus taeanensis]RBW68251.1 hypothetical protein DS031_17925 [Bacillus taeanensis]
MKNQANRFGEIEVSKNNIVYSMPVNRFKTEDREALEQLYKQNLEELNYSEYFAFANSISELRAHFLFSYELRDCVNFMSIRKLKFEEVIPLLKTLVQIAKISEEKQIKILWHASNFFINMGERKIQALLFEFDGMEIFSHKTALDGLKELIILSLTTLNNVIVKKPSKVDFIEKKQETYQFIEDILQARSVDETEIVIDKALVLIEIAAEKEYEENQSKKQRSLLNKWGLKKSVNKPENLSLSDKLKRELLEESQKANAKKFKEKKTLLDKLTSPTGIAVLVPLVVVLLTTYFLTDGFTNFEGNDQTALAKENEAQIKKIYINYINGEKETAYAQLDSIGYKNLSKEDQKMLTKWYIEQRKYIKAISTDKNSAYTIGDSLVKDDNKIDLEQLVNQVESKVLTFDLADLNDDYKVLIANKDLSRFNERRAYAIAKAFYLTNNDDDLEKFITDFEKKSDGSEEYQKQVGILQEAQSIVSSYYETLENFDKQIEEKKKEVQIQETKLEDKKNKEPNKEEMLKSKQEELENLEQQRHDIIKLIEEL